MPKIKRAIFAWSGIVCFTIFADDERKPKPLDRWVEYYKEVAKGNDDFDFKPCQLRLLPTPVYRYSVPKLGVKDGALFTYVLGTDPEVLLLIEARKEGDAENWLIAFGRMTGYACQAMLDDKEFWSCKFPPESTFTQLRLGPTLSGQ